MIKKPFIVGVFGPPGSGKSTILSFFEEKGFAVWRADDAVHDLYKPGAPGTKRIGEFFGKSFIAKDGSVLASRLAKMVLSNPLKFKILEHLIHPLVANEVTHWIDQQKKLGVAKMVIEAAAFEPEGLAKHVDLLLKVTAPKNLCKQRVLARGKTDVYFDALYSVTRDYETPYLIENVGTLADLKNRFEKLYSTVTMSP